MPTVSICIPTYNGQKYLKQCVDSAIAQSYADVEILIIDDASTDSTWDSIMKYVSSDKRIKAYRNEKNVGLVGNFNKCLEMAQGKWVKLLLQDDYLADNCIEVMMTNVASEDKIVACKRTFIFDDTIEEKSKKYYQHEVVTFERLGISSAEPVFIKPGQIAAMAVGNICMNFIGEPTSVMIKKDILAEIGGFNTSLAQICDLEYFLRVASRYGIKYIPAPLSYFRIHGDSTTEKNLQDKTYTLSHIDTIVTVHQLLYDKCYSLFRSNLSISQKLKLKLYFRVRVYESFKSANNTITRSKFEVTSKKYLEIEEYKKGSVFVKLLLWVIKAKRKTRS